MGKNFRETLEEQLHAPEFRAAWEELRETYRDAFLTETV